MPVYINWRWEVVLYLWLAGIAGGAYLAAFAADRFSGGRYRELVRMATYLAVILAGLGALSLILELGRMERFWHIFTRFNLVTAYGQPLQPMSMGSWILLFFTIAGAVRIAGWWTKALGRRVMAILEWVTLVLAGLLILYTGVLLSATNQPLWRDSPVIEAVFVSSAVATGLAALILLGLSGVGEAVSSEAMARLRRVMVVVIVLQMVALAGFLVWLSAAGPAAAQAVAVIITGSLGLAFWLGLVILGLLVPLGIEIWAWRGARMPQAMVILSSALVLLGGLVLRAVVVFGGQMV